ncbi:NAD-dependent epimerase/dehydratase family protein [Paenibacillus foliorum]|uniref:NAD-dependent epimerase/dehydratase family protein n=1 Tax=Paenibacillus foliorum TaxID=2654974 RepID=UPI0028AC93CC|nr:NAD-dependent epimerase/dehydratase family protein [Paenibacillus foliorum]
MREWWVVMKVLFIGGTGLISQAVSKLAVEQGIELYLLNRGQRNDYVPEGANIITGDIRDTSAVAEALANYEFDSVVDWISFTPEQVKANIELLKGKRSRPLII